MSDDLTPRLNLPYLASSQAQKHVTLNEGLGLLDGLVHCAVVSRTVAAEPASPMDGDAWLLPSGRTGAGWLDFPVGAMVRRHDGAWVQLTPPVGTIAYVRDEATLILRTATGFVELLRAGSAGVGVGAAPASGGRLTVGGAPPTVGAISAVGASGGLSLALSDNVNSSLYVRNAPGGAVLGTDPGSTMHLGAGGHGVENRKLSVVATAGLNESAVLIWIDTGPGAAAHRLAVGDPDSAGPGWRTLRIAN